MRAITLTVIGCIWIGGAALLWPASLFYTPHSSPLRRTLFKSFLSQVLLQALAFGYVAYCRQVSADWLHCLLLPYFVGSCFWLLNLVVLVRHFVREKRLRSQRG